MTNQASHLDKIFITTKLTSSCLHDWSVSRNKSVAWGQLGLKYYEHGPNSIKLACSFGVNYMVGNLCHDGGHNYVTMWTCVFVYYLLNYTYELPDFRFMGQSFDLILGQQFSVTPLPVNCCQVCFDVLLSVHLQSSSSSLSGGPSATSDSLV